MNTIGTYSVGLTTSVLDNLLPKSPRETKHLALNEVYKVLYDKMLSNHNKKKKYEWVTIVEYADGSSKQVRLPYREAQKHLLSGHTGTSVNDFDSKGYYTQPLRVRQLPSGKVTVKQPNDRKGYRNKAFLIRHLISTDAKYVCSEIHYCLQKLEYEYDDGGRIRSSYYRTYDRTVVRDNIFEDDKELDAFYIKLRESFEKREERVKIDNDNVRVVYGSNSKSPAIQKAPNVTEREKYRRVVDAPMRTIAENDRDKRFVNGINPNTEEIRLDKSPELTIPYRMDRCHSAIDYDASMFPSKPKWIEQITRPVWYVDGCEYSNPYFDCNTFYFYLNKEKVKSILQRCIMQVNNAQSKSKALPHADSFIKALMDCAFVLYYINLSNGWKIEDISFDTIWNLMNYILFEIRPFEKSETEPNKNWMKRITLAWMLYKAQKYYAHITYKPIVVCYKALAKKFSSGFSKCLKPKDMTDEAFRDWKMANGIKRKKQNTLTRKKQERHKRKGANERMARDAKILNLHNAGKSNREIENLLGVNYYTVCRTIRNNPLMPSTANKDLVCDESFDAVFRRYPQVIPPSLALPKDAPKSNSLF